MPGPFMGKRVAAVVICGLLVGGISAALAAASAIQPASGAPGVAQSGSSATQTASSAASPTPRVSPTASPTDTAVPQPTATREPRPTPCSTSTPPGSTQLRGRVTSVSGSTFMLQTSSSAVTVDTNGQTQFTCQSHSLGGLQGCSVYVYGSWSVQNQTFLAAQVNATDC